MIRFLFRIQSSLTPPVRRAFFIGLLMGTLGTSLTLGASVWGYVYTAQQMVGETRAEVENLKQFVEELEEAYINLMFPMT